MSYTHVRWALLPLLSAVGCDHTAPFETHPPPPIVGPLGTGVPVRLTYNIGTDAYPSWTPDGLHVIYQAQDVNRADQDRCLLLLPAEGGTATPVACDKGTGSQDSTNVFGPAALSPSGRLTFFRSAEPAGFGVATTAGIYLTSGVPVVTADSFLALPVPTPNGARADKLTSMHWLGDSGFLALGVRTSLYTPCKFCKTDTLETGLQVFWVDVRSAPPGVVTVPGTARASSFSFVAPDTIYFTLNGDARILRTRVGGGAVDSVYALPRIVVSVAGTSGLDTVPTIARGVEVHGNLAYAVGAGWITYLPDTGQGESQWDRGGDLHQIYLSAGVDTVIDQNPPMSTVLWIRNPALSPDGHRLTAEGRVALLLPEYAGDILVRIDTTITYTGNLWQYVFP